MHFTTASLVAGTFAVSASAYSATGRTFAVNHFYGKGPLAVGRMDPIISPGATSGHVHAIQGGNNFAISMTDEQALDSSCTSSLVKNDKSNYWTPALYFKDPKNGSLESVDMFYMNVYYFFEATTDKIEAFQPGHRMVIGDPSLRTPPATGGKSITDLSDGAPQPVQFTCPRSSTGDPLYPTDSTGLDGVGIQDPGNKGAGVGFPDQNCDGYASPLRADIHFPSCYNPAAGLDAYKTNMEFPTNGNCPEGWTHTPHLFYEVYWNTPDFADRWTPGEGTQPFVLANGDPTGYGLHADFISGWDVDTLQQIIDNCDAGDSGMDKCPGLIGGLNDASTSCNIECPINEQVAGVMDALPGNNPIGAWGVNVTSPAPATSGASSVVVPTTASVATSASAQSTASSETTKQVVSVPESSVVVATSVDKAQAPSTTAPSTTAPAVTTPADVSAVTVPTSEPTLVSSDGSNTLVTSWVSETTVIWTTVTATGPAPTSTSTSSSEVEDGWSYQGCYSDIAGDRVLSGITFANVGQHAVTNTKCVAYCSAAGYSMAGTEYGGQCFCGDTLVGSSTADESGCDTPCEGDSTQTCGGSLLLSVYSTTASTKARRSSKHLHRHLHDASF